MKNIFLIILTATTLKVAGQNHLFGVKYGINQTNITTSSNFVDQHDFRTGISAGLTYEYLFKKHFSLGADLIYNQRGFTFRNEIVFTDNLGNPASEKYITKFNYDYISVPIKAMYNIGNKFYGFTNIGVIPSILFDAKTTTSTFGTDGKLTGKRNFDVTSLVSKFDFAGLVEIGGGYKFKNGFWLYTSFAYQHSFTTITNSKYFSYSKIQHNGMTLTLGLKRALTKE